VSVRLLEGGLNLLHDFAMSGGNHAKEKNKVSNS
jgi:hypothetical protein